MFAFPECSARRGGRLAVLAMCAAILTALGTAAAAAQAAPPPPAPHTEGPSGWRVDCSNDGKTLDCRVLHQVVQRENQQLVAAVSIRLSAEKKPQMAVQLPLGIQVGEGVNVRVDEGNQERIAISTCTQSGCFASAPVTDGLIAAMRTGRDFKLSFLNLNRQTVLVTMPLLGFGLAFDKIK